jgi:hypothetical protein
LRIVALETFDHVRIITENVINCQSDRTAMAASQTRLLHTTGR